jgi:fatty acid CoA ligase FadD9
MGDIEASGTTKRYESIHVNPNECLTVVYTSGSSGFPKGSMISESAYQTAFLQRYSAFRLDPIYFCYEPLAWITGRSAVFKTFFAGGRTGFSTGEVSLLMEELAIVRPTNFSATPAIWNKIYTEYQAALSLAHGSEEDRLLEQFSRLIPMRCKRINVGGAMISSVVLNFIKRCFSRCCVYESYGITECGPVASNNTINDTVRFRLISIPEMGYTTEDKPVPRGELVIKSDEMFSGYMNNLEETQSAFTEDGFFHTGDIVELSVGPDEKYHVNLIDRKKNFFKLSQGQYVSPEYLQTIYIQSPFVEQIYVHGDHLADSILAVIVPNQDFAHAFASEHDWKTLDTNNVRSEFSDAILENIRSLAKKHSLHAHEIPSQIIIDFRPFTPENGLLTATMKLCRPKLAVYYADRLKTSHTVEERLRKLIETATNQSCINDEKKNTFIPTGGDSLTAIRLSHIIESDLGISIPIRLLLDSNTTLQQLAATIENPTRTYPVSRTQIEQLIHDSTLPFDITVDQCHTSASPSMIFVTGVTGFVGAFLLTELLLAYPPESQIFCLVRCQSSVNPLDRIRENLLFYQLWREDFRQRILPLRGDLEKTYFGLDHETYQSLAKQIDLIFHCGAEVNFVLPYSKLYRSNVYGIHEIIRLATFTTTSIPIHYISTVSLLTLGVASDISVDEISPEGLISGYAQSKWVAEKLLAKVQRLGLPVTIYRLGSTWASTESGACNRADLQTLLFVAMMKSNSYPETWIHTRLHGLPVDWTAKSIVHLARDPLAKHSGKIHYIHNPNSAVSFKCIIGSMRRCGMQVTSIPSETWRRKLKSINDGNSSIAALSEFSDTNLFKEDWKGSGEQFCNFMTALSISPLDEAYWMKWFTFILANILCLH